MNARLLAICVVMCFLALATAPVVESAGRSQSALTITVAMRSPQGRSPDASGGDSDPGRSGTQVSPTAGSARSFNVEVVADDDNGHNDIRSVTVAVYKSDQATVHIADAAATKTAGSGRSGTYSTSVAMNYYDAPGTYWIRAQVEDRDGSVDTKWTNFTYESLAAIGLGSSTVTLNPGGNSSTTMSPGGSSHDNPASVTIYNRGNVITDLIQSGTDLTNATSGVTIPVSNIHVSPYANMSNEIAVGSSPSTLTAWDLPVGQDSSKTLYVALHVPTGVPRGTYTGGLTLSGVAS